MPGEVPSLSDYARPLDPKSELAYTLKTDVATLLDRQSLGFPGAQPVSFARRHFKELKERDFYICEKSDGVRCLLYTTTTAEDGELHYLIDRKNDYYYVPKLHFPLGVDDPALEAQGHVDTLLDGELLFDFMPDGSKVLKYLVFDCLALDGQRMMARTLDKRLAYFVEKIYAPYHKLFRKYPEEKKHQPFLLEKKNFEFAYAVWQIFERTLPNLKHGNDGLIFTCRTSPYRFGTDENILKWKPAEENSVDFRLALEIPTVEPDSDDEDRRPFPDYEAVPTLHLQVYYGGNGEYRNFAELHVTRREWAGLTALETSLDHRIVECTMDERKRWRFLRFRDDKTDANHISTVEKVLESIEDAVSEDDLKRQAGEIRERWKARAEEEKRRARG